MYKQHSGLHECGQSACLAVAIRTIAHIKEWHLHVRRNLLAR